VTQKTNNHLSSGQGPASVCDLFAVYRVDPVMGGQVIAGRLRPELDLDSADVRSALERWPGSYSTREGPHGWELLLFQPAEHGERWWLHVALFVLTLFSTTVAGSLLAGYSPIAFFHLRPFASWWVPVPFAVDLRALAAGLPFGLSLVAVLALHEAGHYFAAKHHSISVTPPYFIPFPPYVSIIGTLGAFIRLRSPVMSRNTLLDVGAAGPLVSFAVSLPLVWWGLRHSAVLPTAPGLPAALVVRLAGEQFSLGGSLAMWWLVRLVLDLPGSGYVVVLHPVAFAGWLGLFVTALNLLPISQLDGGHILYAILGSRHWVAAALFFLALLPLGFLWAGWWVWAALVFLVGRGRIWHPPLFNPAPKLTSGRLGIALAAAVVFVLCFIPVPFRI
jgi:membrane-associated protease RseP (regulator of RpoE activity)